MQSMQPVCVKTLKIPYDPIRVTDARVNKRKTQVMLAQETGVSEITICRIEKGTSVSLDTLSRICDACDVELSTVLVSDSSAITPIPTKLRYRRPKK